MTTQRNPNMAAIIRPRREIVRRAGGSGIPQPGQKRAIASFSRPQLGQADVLGAGLRTSKKNHTPTASTV